jgi:SAM-dependent methyltransferase
MSGLTQDPQSFRRNWTAYYQAVEGRPPRETLLDALARFEAEGVSTGFAIDLGCGDGRDTVELLRRGWQVLAIDGEGEAISRLLSRPDIDTRNLATVVDRFETMHLPQGADLINASFCLPFCPPAHFPSVWSKIRQALRPGGRFCGQLIGDRDSWAISPVVTDFTRPQLDELLQGFNVELLQEEDHPGKTALGEEKHWHLFHIVATHKSGSTRIEGMFDSSSG